MNTTYEFNTKKDAACYSVCSVGWLGTDYDYSYVLDARRIGAGYNDVSFVQATDDTRAAVHVAV